VRYETVHMLLALAALEQWYFLAVDIKSAYLYGPLEEEIYMEQPEGYHVQPGKVWKLLKALYSLKQARHVWWKELKKSMYAMNYRCTKSNSRVFVHKTSDGIVIAIVYVDDSIFFGSSPALVAAKHKEFMERWECRNLGEPKEFLHMHIRRPDLSNIFLNQTMYLHKVLAHFGQTNACPAPTPLPAGYYPIANQGEVNLQLRSKYQKLIGSLLYLMIGTHLDIAFAVTKLAQHAANPSQDHYNRALHVCCYLVGMPDYMLHYKGCSEKGFQAYIDTDWASNPNTRKSTTGFFVKLADCVFSWKSQAQKCITLSSMEPEYIVASDCCKQLINLNREIGYPLCYIPLAVNNQGVIFLASNPAQERQTKHVDIAYHHICECIKEGKVKPEYIPGAENPADLLTKNLNQHKYCIFLPVFGLKDIPSDHYSKILLDIGMNRPSS
jgi:hypothetical protein